jgi:hypothetical protein
MKDSKMLTNIIQKVRKDVNIRAKVINILIGITEIPTKNKMIRRIVIKMLRKLMKIVVKKKRKVVKLRQNQIILS